MDVDGLHRIAAIEIDTIEGLRQAQHILIIRAIADPAALFQIHRIGRACDHAKGGAAISNLNLSCRVSGGYGKAFRGTGNHFHDKIAIKFHIECDRIHVTSGLFQDVPGFFVQEQNTDFFQHAHRGVVDLVHPLFIQWFGGFINIGQLSPGHLMQGACRIGSVAVLEAG